MIHLLFRCGLRDNDGASLQVRDRAPEPCRDGGASACRGRAGAATAAELAAHSRSIPTPPRHGPVRPAPAATPARRPAPHRAPLTSSPAVSGRHRSGPGTVSRAARSRRRSPARGSRTASSATTCPVARSIAHMPQVRSSSASRSTIGMPLKTALLRTCDSPTKARFPAKSSPRVKPGTSAIGTYLRVCGSMNPSVPRPTRRPRAGRRTSVASEASTTRGRSPRRRPRPSVIQQVNVTGLRHDVTGAGELRRGWVNSE